MGAEWIVVPLVALCASALTLFSGFGLGTLLLPAFALFFPVEVAVAATAIVHLANGLFKLGLLWRGIDRSILLRFGLAAVVAAFAGAAALEALAHAEPLARWRAAGMSGEVTPVKLTMGVLIAVFAVLDLVPGRRALKTPRRWLPLGGALSGFFGGLSGHQGALRAAFLVPLGLSPLAFAGTQAALAVMVDLARLTVYGVDLAAGSVLAEHRGLIALSCAAAFSGAVAARKLLPRITVGFVQRLTGALLLLVAAVLASGVI